MKQEKIFLLATKETIGTYNEMILFAKKTNKGFIWTLSKNNAFAFTSHTKAKRTANELHTTNEIFIVEQA